MSSSRVILYTASAKDTEIQFGSSHVQGCPFFGWMHEWVVALFERPLLPTQPLIESKLRMWRWTWMWCFASTTTSFRCTAASDTVGFRRAQSLARVFTQEWTTLYVRTYQRHRCESSSHANNDASHLDKCIACARLILKRYVTRNVCTTHSNITATKAKRTHYVKRSRSSVGSYLPKHWTLLE